MAKGIPDLLVNDSPVSDAAGKGALFNQFFSDQCKLPPGSDTDPLPDFEPVSDSSLADISTTPTEVHKILKSLNVSKAAGPDGISNRILKER